MNAERSGSTTLTGAPFCSGLLLPPHEGWIAGRHVRNHFEPRNGKRTGCSIGGIAQPSSPAGAMRRIITLAACVTFAVSTWAAAQEPLTRVSLDDALQLASFALTACNSNSLACTIAFCVREVRGATGAPGRNVGLFGLFPALLAEPLDLKPLAYANALDPLWDDGMPDCADQDDSVVLIVSGAGAFALRPLAARSSTPPWVRSGPLSTQSRAFRVVGGWGSTGVRGA